MCRKNRNKYYNKPVSRKNSAISEADALIQMLRIRIWQIIARNNTEELTDPLLRPLKTPMPYVQNIPNNADYDDIANIKPTLDEILPLPKKTEIKSALPKEEVKPEAKSEPISDEPKAEAKTEEVKSKVKPKSKKTSAKELVADESGELPGQMTMYDAIAEAGSAKPQQQAQVQTEEQSKNQSEAVQSQSKSTAPSESEEQQKNSAEESEEQKPTLRERYIVWKVSRANHNDYFGNLKVQIANKNEACFEILDYLDELQSGD